MLNIYFTKYAWVKPLKVKKTKTVQNGNKSKRQRKRLWIDQGREFYNSSMQKWLDDNYILIYLTHNEGKSVVAEIFLRTLKIKIYEKTAANNKNLILVIWID